MLGYKCPAIAGHSFLRAESAAGTAAPFCGAKHTPANFDGFLLPQAFADFSNQRVFGGLSSKAQVCAVRIREGGSLKSLAHASLIVIDIGKIAVGRHVVHQELYCLTPPFNA